AGSIVGAFSTIDLPTLPSSLFWNVNTSATSLTLSILGGDYNHDGVVNGADFTAWKNTFGGHGDFYSGAAGNGTGIRDSGGYTIWQNFVGSVAFSGGSGGSGGLSAGEVPEPGTIVLLLMGAGMLAPAARRRWAGR